MDGDEASRSKLQAQFAALLQRRHQESKLRDLKASPPDSVDFSSNDFLSLATSASLQRRFWQELQSSSFQLGSTGSRLLDGNSTYAEALERDLANFHNAPTGLLANSGFDANVGIFSCLPQPGDIVVYDELIHASVHDGMKLSRAGSAVPFAHNSITELRGILETCKSATSSRPNKRNVFVAVESVYSMEGDLAPLTEIVQLIEELFPQNDCHLIVDEAHATGVYGTRGKGRVSELGLENRVFIRLHTFGKALACNGAIILCTPLTRLYLINYARPLIYTTFMSFSSLGAIKAAYRFMAEGETEPLSRQLFSLISILHAQLRELQGSWDRAEIPKGLIDVPSECPNSPIFALMSSQPRSLAKYCQDAGFVVRAVVPPTVPEGTERVRVCLHAGNTEAQIRLFVQTVKQWTDAQTRSSSVVASSPERAKL